MITLKPKESLPIALGKKWLNVFSVSAPIVFKSIEHSMEETLRSAKSYDVEGLFSAQLYNPLDEDVTVDFENSELQTASSVTNVGNEPWIAGIRQPIRVDAQATVENGKMSMLGATSMRAVPDITIPSYGIVLFAPARVGRTSRRVTVQIITPDEAIQDPSGLSKIRIGSSSSLKQNEGIYLQGTINSSQGYELETDTPIYIRNMTNDTVVITGAEQWR